MITKGTKVAILPNSDYGNRFTGSVGIVKANSKNHNSSYGLFWFEEKYLAVIPDVCNIAECAVIKHVIYSGSKTIILWLDGTKTIVSCGKDDIFDPYAGFCAAVAKKMFGSTSKIKKIIKRYTKENK